MKTFTRYLSIILSFQLLVGCNELKLVQKPSSDFIEISGSVAKAMNHLTNFIMPSAMAQDGALTVYDVSDPNDPIEVHSEKISGSTFSIQVKKELVKDRPIKISFESFEDDSKSREMIVPASTTLEKISAKLDQESSIKSKITEWEYKIQAEKVVTAESNAKLATALKRSNDSEMNIINNKEAVLALLFHSPDVARETAYWIAVYKISIDKNDQEVINQSQEEVKSIAIKFGYFKDVKENPYFSILSQLDEIDLSEIGSLKEGAEYIDKKAQAVWEKAVAEMRNDKLDEKSALWIEVIEKLTQIKDEKYKELDNRFLSDSKYSEQIKKIAGISFELIYSHKEGEALMEKIIPQIQKDIEELMQKDGLTQKDAEWASTIKAIDQAKQAKYDELYSLSWSKSK